MRTLDLPLVFVLALWGCDEPASDPTPHTAESAKTEVSAKAHEPAAPTEKSSEKPVPKLPEEDREDKPVNEMSDQELEVACFEGRREACDLLGH